jgi:predicted GIY-YIG superfamily endonuclease
MIAIYSIKNKENNKIYIGGSTNVFKRLNQHMHELLNNTHCNEIMQKDFNKYGYKSFAFEILEICIEFELKKLEKKYINNLNPSYDYNMINYYKGYTNEKLYTKAQLSITNIKKYLEYCKYNLKHDSIAPGYKRVGKAIGITQGESSRIYKILLNKNYLIKSNTSRKTFFNYSKLINSQDFL